MSGLTQAATRAPETAHGMILGTAQYMVRIAPMTLAGPSQACSSEEPTISPDGRWLFYNKGGGGASLWMLTIGRDAEPAS